MRRSLVEALVGKRVIVKFAYDAEEQRYFIARMERIAEDDEAVFSEEEWADSARELGVNGERLEINCILV
jgi:hypothetical protein